MIWKLNSSGIAGSALGHQVSSTSLNVIANLIRRLNDALGVTSIVVTYDVAESLKIVDYVYLISNGVVAAGDFIEMMSSWPRSVPNVQRRLQRDPVAKPEGKYVLLGQIADKWTLNPGYPGYTNAGIDEIFNKFMIPQMFAEVAQGKRTPEEAAKVYDRSFRRIFQRWRNLGKI